MNIVRRGALLGAALVFLLALGLTTNVLQFGIPLMAQTGELSYFSCSFAGFLPSTSGVEYRSTTPPGSSAAIADYRPTDDLFGGTLLCPVNLPQGAEIQRVNFGLFSSTATGLSARVDCFLKREQIVNTFLTPQAVNIAQAQSTPVLGRTTVTSVVNPNNATVDNSNFSYYLSCSIPSNQTNVGIIGANIEYFE